MTDYLLILRYDQPVIIKRALGEKQRNLFNIISINYEISKQQKDEIKKEVIELRHSIRRQSSIHGRQFRTHCESCTGHV